MEYTNYLVPMVNSRTKKVAELVHDKDRKVEKIAQAIEAINKQEVLTSGSYVNLHDQVCAVGALMRQEDLGQIKHYQMFGLTVDSLPVEMLKHIEEDYDLTVQDLVLLQYNNDSMTLDANRKPVALAYLNSLKDKPSAKLDEMADFAEEAMK